MSARVEEDKRVVPKLSWQDRPLRAVVRMAWPICVSMLGYSTMQVIDTFFVGRLGASALAGVALGGTINFALVVFSIGMLRAVKVLVSQADGAGEPELANCYWTAGIAFGACAGIVTAGVGHYLATVIPALSQSAKAGDLAGDFLGVASMGAPLWLMSAGLREGRYGLGDTRGPMVATLCQAVVKILADYFFIVVFRMGVHGAAWATFLAVATEFLALLCWCLPRLRLRFSWSRLVILMQVGLPTGIQFVIEFGAFAMLSILIARMSEVDMAAHQIALQTIHFSFLPALAMGEALSVFAGQAIGAGMPQLVRRLAFGGVVLTIIYTALCTIATAVGAHTIAGWFTSDPAVASKAASLLYVALVFQIADGAAIVARSVLRGTGDVRFPAVAGIVIAWCATPPMCWWLGVHCGWGAIGGWIGLCVEIALNAFIMWWRLWGGHWHAASARTRSQAVSH